MRIVADIPHPRLKITVFHYEDKYSVKLQGGGMECHLNYKENEFSAVEEVKDLLETGIIKEIDQCFFKVSTLRKEYFVNALGEDDFPEII